MTNAHDIIAGVLQDPPMYSSKVARHILAALRDAVGASDTDSITIAADGTVGRLEHATATEGTVPEYDDGTHRLWLLVGASGNTVCSEEHGSHEPLFRVVTP
jgi:hypothetical protein